MFKRGVSKPMLFDPKDRDSASRTQQQFAKDADINNIMRRYEKTGVLENPLNADSRRVPVFGDFSGITGLDVMLDTCRRAQEGFMTLSPATRAKFDNDVSKAVDFISDPKNLKEAVELGMLPKEMLPPAGGAAPQVPPAPPAPVTPAPVPPEVK